MQKILRVFALLACGLFLFAGSVRADEGTIAVGGEFVMQLRAGEGDKSVKDRADIITERLQDILALKKLSGRDIKAVPLDKMKKDTNYNIMVRDKLLIMVTPEDGSPNKRNVKQQAEDWVKQLRKVLPKLAVKPNPNNQKE